MTMQAPEAPLSADIPPVASSLAISIGATLRQARERHGLTVEAVAQTLRLGSRQVQAMESENWAALPGIATTRGFLRNYARLLEIDAEPLLKQLAVVLGKTPDNLVLPEQNGATVATPGSRALNLRPILSGIAALAVAGGLYVTLPSDLSGMLDEVSAWLHQPDSKPAETVVTTSAESGAQSAENPPLFPPGSGPQQVLIPPPPEENAPTPVAPLAERDAPGVVGNANPAAAPLASADKGSQIANVPVPAVNSVVRPATAPARGGEASLSVTWSKASWIEVRDRDNKVILSQRATAGTEQAVVGQPPFSLIVGYAPGVSLRMRDQAVDLKPHTRGDVARLVLD